MGFRPEVEDFQPYYKFHKKHLKDLRVGASVLLEALDVQMTKEEKLAASLKSKKDEEAARVAQVSSSRRSCRGSGDLSSATRRSCSSWTIVRRRHYAINGRSSVQLRKLRLVTRKSWLSSRLLVSVVTSPDVEA